MYITQSNFRNVQDWVNKTEMDKIGKWATDYLEVFATALLLKTYLVSFYHMEFFGLDFEGKVLI